MILIIYGRASTDLNITLTQKGF